MLKRCPTGGAYGADPHPIYTKGNDIMKRFVSLLAAAILTVFSIGNITALAFSGTVTIEGDRQITAGTAYTYTITVSVENAGTVIADIDCSGIFQKESGDSIIEWSQVTNSSGVIYTGSVTVKVSSAATPGETGTISVSGSVVTYINDNYETDEKDFSGSLTAEVAADGAAAEPSEWDVALRSVQSMESGGSISLEITQSGVIPAEVLEALKEKQGTLTLKADGFSCVIDGKALEGIPGSLKATDITSDMEKEKALSAAANGQDTYQLNFAREGQLPGKFRFSFAAAESKPGDVLYLYRYYSDSGTLEETGVCAVDADGFAAFDIYYCSGYVVSSGVIEGAAGVLSSGGALSEQLQTQLKNAYAANEGLQSQLEEANAAAESQAAYYKGMISIPFPVFAGAAAGALLIAVILTMALTKAGLFAPKKSKGKKNTRNTITVRDYREV